jgi:hypothetical protein
MGYSMTRLVQGKRHGRLDTISALLGKGQGAYLWRTTGDATAPSLLEWKVDGATGVAS